MAESGRPEAKLSRLSKAELIERLEELKRQSRRSADTPAEHHHLEQTLRDSEVLLRHAVEMANLGYWIWDDQENKCIYCSEHLAKMHGMTVDGYLAKLGSYGAILEKIHPEDRVRYGETLSRATNRKEPYAIEFRELKPNGEVRFLREVGEPVLDREDRLVRTIGILQDITETKRIVEMLRESEAWYRELFDESPVSLWVEDWSRLKAMLDDLVRQGVKDLCRYFRDHPDQLRKAYDTLEIVDISQETLRLFRAASKEALIAKWHSAHVDPEDLAEFNEQVTRLYDGAASYHHETCERACDGSEIFTRTRTVVPPGYRDSWARVLVAIEDITERNEALGVMRESEAWFRELFDDSPVSLWVEDWSGVKAMLDRLAAQGVTDLLGYFRDHPDRLREAYDAPEIIDISREALRVYRASSKEELIAISGSDHADPDDLSGFGEQIARLFDGALANEFEACETACDGSMIHTRMRTVIAPRYRDSWSRVLVSIDDISERVAAEATLRERDAGLRDLRKQLEHVSRLSAMGQLSRTLAGELNQPLTAVMNYGSAARRLANTGGGPESHRIVEMLDKAIGQAMQAGAVVRHLRDHFEQAHSKTTPQDVNRVIDDALALALIDPAQAGILCEVNLSDGLPKVSVSQIQIQQVAFNLIRNSLEAMAHCEQRQLTIKTSLDESGAVTVTVSDTGRGIPPEVEKRLFEPFVTTKKDGLGLGLSISHGIIEAHGGRLWSEPNPGGGTKFHFTLLVAAQAGSSDDG